MKCCNDIYSVNRETMDQYLSPPIKISWSRSRPITTNQDIMDQDQVVHTKSHSLSYGTTAWGQYHTITYFSHYYWMSLTIPVSGVWLKSPWHKNETFQWNMHLLLVWQAFGYSDIMVFTYVFILQQITQLYPCSSLSDVGVTLLQVLIIFFVGYLYSRQYSLFNSTCM